jgi:NAD(P)-dependent dehydrogenase (short-subunit alcohol dehydrogenase family)
LENKDYILITGASSGIGQHIAIRLSEEYNIILNGRDENTLDDVINQCNQKQNILKWGFDCAGFLKMVPLKTLSMHDLQRTMNVNVNAAALLIKSLISKKINESFLQNVVFISSTASIRGVKAFNMYSASKGAADSLMRSLAVELAPRVRLNSVLPGSIKTKMTEHIYNDDSTIERMIKDHPLGLGETSDIFEMVNFLLSEKSRWITGQQFIVDGGRTINISA